MRNRERMITGKIICALCMISSLIVSGTVWASVTAPDAGGKLAIGFDGSDVTTNGSLVVSWNDQVSARGVDNAAASGTRSPTLTTADTGNGMHNVLDFNGTNYLKTQAFADGDMNQLNAIFIVAKWNALDNDYLFDGISSDKRHAAYTRSGDTYGMYAGKQIGNGNVPATTNEFQVFSAVFNGTNSLFRINGTTVLSGDIGSDVLGGLSIGSNYGTHNLFQGQVAEVLVYNGGLDTAELKGIEEYLLNKYILQEHGGLVAQWDFSDGTYNDQAGINDGQGMGTISIVASGNSNFVNAIETGTNLDDVLNVGTLSSLNLSTNSFTLSYWVKRDPFLTADNGNNYRRVFESNNSGTSAGIQTTLRSSDASNPNKLYSTLQGYGGTADKLLTGGTVADSSWHWIVIRYDGDTDTATYFEDGHFYDTETGVFSLADGSRKVYIGNGMGGMIGDIRIYNQALSYTLNGSNDLSDGELYAIYGNPVPPGIIGFSAVSDDLMKMVVHTSTVATNDYFPMATPDLDPASWADVPHSKDGSDPFIVTNLSYSTTDGTNKIIYVKVADAKAFFRIGE